MLPIPSKIRKPGYQRKTLQKYTHLYSSWGKQLAYTSFSSIFYCCVLLIRTLYMHACVCTCAHTYTRVHTLSTYSCCNPCRLCKAEDPLSMALSSLSLGNSSGDMEVGSTLTKKKKKGSTVDQDVCTATVIFTLTIIFRIPILRSRR